jgi:hypothetical protein
MHGYLPIRVERITITIFDARISHVSGVRIVKIIVAETSLVLRAKDRVFFAAMV